MPQDDNVMTPNDLETGKQLDQVEQTELGGTPISKKDVMPFPDNVNPDSTFNSRFGDLPPSGILNDIKPTNPDRPLIRKISDITEGGQKPLSKFYADQIGGGIAPETIRSPALEMDGELFEAQNHGMALNNFMNKYPNQPIPKDWKDGFTTTHGRFISREEAFDMAKDQGLIKPEVLPALTSESKMLLSEDLSP